MIKETFFFEKIFERKPTIAILKSKSSFDKEYSFERAIPNLENVEYFFNLLVLNNYFYD